MIKSDKLVKKKSEKGTNLSKMSQTCEKKGDKNKQIREKMSQTCEKR